MIGCNSAIVHLYNSVSTLQRRVVFKQDRIGVKNIALDGAKYILNKLNKFDEGVIKLQYSPESFTGTELDYALEVCEEVLDCWKANQKIQLLLTFLLLLKCRHKYLCRPNRVDEQQLL